MPISAVRPFRDIVYHCMITAIIRILLIIKIIIIFLHLQSWLFMILNGRAKKNPSIMKPFWLSLVAQGSHISIKLICVHTGAHLLKKR